LTIHQKNDGSIPRTGNERKAARYEKAVKNRAFFVIQIVSFGRLDEAKTKRGDPKIAPLVWPESGRFRVTG